MNEQELLEQAISAMEAQRPLLGDAVVNPAIAALREKLSALQMQASAGQRKQVTVLFADLVGFTSLAEKMDAEQVGDLIAALWQRLDAAILHNGGIIDQHIGDAVVAVWGAGESQENDAERAVHTALALHNEIKQLSSDPSQPLRLRVGIHTGLVYVTPADTPGRLNITGTPLQLAETIQHAAPPGGILISQDTLAHVRGVFSVVPQKALDSKETPTPLQVYQVVSARPRAFRMGTRGIEGIETRMVGRDDELGRMKHIFQNIITNSEFCLVTISGDAGIGKTRLVHEFDQWADSLPVRVRYFKGRAGLDMQRTPYSLLRDLFVFRFQILDTDDKPTVWQKVEQGVAEALPDVESEKVRLYAHFIGHLIGFDFSDSPLLSSILSDSRQLRNRAISYMCEYFQGFCRRSAVLILLEDIHWADDASLEAIQTLAESLAGYPALIVCTTRPQLFEHKPNWPQRGAGDRGESGLTAELVPLDPLAPEATRELVQHILQKVPEMPEALIELMTSSAEGNPFYIEELTKMLIEDGVIVKGEDTWQVDTSRLTSARVPATLTGVLQARLDSLQMRERLALQSAAVIGPTFWDAAVAHLFSPVERPAGSGPIDEILSGLRFKEMIFRRDKSVFAGTLEYIFKNAVLREVTYESISKRERRVSHARVAEWLMQITEQSGRSGEYARLVAEHFERAGDSQQASTWYLTAARQAAGRFALADAALCYSRALELAPADDLPARYEILSGREKVYDLQAERLLQQQDLDALRSLAEKSSDPRSPILVALRSANFGFVTSSFAPALRDAEEALSLAEGLGDNELQARAALEAGQVHWRLSEYQAAKEKLHSALTLSRLAGAPALEAEALRNLGVIEQDQGNYPQAGAFFQQTLTLYQRLGDRVGEANTYSSLGNLAIDLSDHASSCAYHEMALQLRREIGDRRGQARSLGSLGFIASDQGDYTGSKNYFEQALRLFRQIDDRQGEAVALVNLGNDAITTGDYAAAAQYQEQALRIQREINERQGQCVALDNLSLLHHYMDEQPQALEYALQALEIARAANLRHYLGYIYDHQAHALLSMGRAEEAESLYRDSLTLRRELGEHTLALESLSGLVRVHLFKKNIPAALQEAHELYNALQGASLDGMVEPFRCYLSVAQAMQAAGDAQAKEVLTQAARLLNERAAKILDPELRRKFLENVPAHRSLMEMAK